jgi:hypothetical protein
MRILKNYQCTNPPSPWRPIASNQSNLPKASPDSGQTKDTIRGGLSEKKNFKTFRDKI